VSEQLKAVRPAAVNNKMEGVYMQLDVSGNTFGVLEGLSVLTRVDAYVSERLWIRRPEGLKLIWVALGWVVSKRVDRNSSDEELDDRMAETERLRDRLRALMDRFEAMKLATLKGAPTPRAAILKNTAAVLRALDPAARRDVLIAVDRGVNIRETLRQILEKALAGGAPEDAGRGGDPRRRSGEAVNT
jgi:hypothetical protein